MARLLKFRRMTLLTFVGLALACTGCASPRPTYESLEWNVGPDFDRVCQAKPGVSGIRTAKDWESYYVKRGETVDNWTVRAASVVWDVDFTVLGPFHWQPNRVMAFVKANQNARRCATDDWTVLQQDRTSILYDWKNVACPGDPEQQEIVRVVMGRWRLWIIWYGIRNTTLSPDQRTVLIENLLTARVMNGGSRGPMSAFARRMARLVRLSARTPA
jgi:hypothetical protein